MAGTLASAARVTVDGKFFRLGGRKFFVKGVTYGPFAPNAQGEMFPDRAQAARDLRQIRDLGANVLRVYYVPPRWFLDLAAEQGLRLLIDIPWAKHLCVLDSPQLQREARAAVRDAAAACRGHPAVFAYSVGNEIPAEIVRWSGARAVGAFLDELVSEARAADPGCLCTYTNFPPTEYLNPRRVDFVSFNVYLHERGPFRDYLARLQMLAQDRPLLLAEFGMDSAREGEERKCEFLSGQIELAFRGGAAGTIVFSFTDDWWRGGMRIEDWFFGLTTRDRTPKPSFDAVQRAYAAAPYFKLPRTPRVSVVVASYNGGRTLPACLESLTRLNYPDYEVIFVDDGSTDDTAEIVRRFPTVRALFHNQNKGLSTARNTGVAAATGEIVAFTDSDCRADEDWLYYLVGDLLEGGFAGIGGPNLLPPDDSPVAAAVMVSPGGPAHVLLSDREAEHVPGCNMAFYKRVLEEIGGFDPVFLRAGDDVDVCWRLQQRGYRIGFSPAAFVWHHRRSTPQAYLRQQRGYGEAEALLARKHPDRFNPVGHGIWRGRIYAPGKAGVVLERSIIYHGLFGSGLFQKLYAGRPSLGLMLCTSLEYHVGVTAPLLVLSPVMPVLLPLGITALLLSLGVCAVAAAQAELPPDRTRFWSRPLVAALFFLQPVVRGYARYRASLGLRSEPRGMEELRQVARGERRDVLCYWSKGEVGRYHLLSALLARLEAQGWQARADSGWNDYDLEIIGNRWTHLRVLTVMEELDGGRRTLRCRLSPRWSLFARVFFWGLFGVELVVIGFLAERVPWIWMLLLTLPLVNWFLDFERGRLHSSLAVLVDDVATKLGLVKVPDAESKTAGSAPSEAARR